MKFNKRRIIGENAAIYTMVVVAAAMLLFSFMHLEKLQEVVYSVLEMNRIVQRVFAVVMIIAAVNLRKRKRSAWIVSVSVLALSILIHLRHPHNELIVAILICEVILLFVFILTRSDFNCPSDKRSAKMSMIFGGIGVLGLLLNMGAGYYMLHNSPGTANKISFFDSLKYALSELFSLGPGGPGADAKVLHFSYFAFWFTWGCIIMMMILLVKPFLDRKETTAKELVHARTLVNRYGQNPSAYLALEDDKTLYFGKQADGVIAYGTVGDTIVIDGDPICADEDFPVLLKEFTEFAIKSAHSLFYLSVTDKYLEEYQRQGYGFVKCGEEARFKLQEYDLAGKKGAKMRANMNHATRAGLQVHEYKVAEHREPELDQEFDRISGEWLSEKSSGQLGFSIGGVGLDKPMDKRYFYAVDESNKMQGFVVFCPFGEDQSGYMADVTRRANDAPGGIMEKIIYEAFQVFKSEGREWGSMGLAPLANLTEEGKQPSHIEQLLTFIYDNLNKVYGFKNLYQAKEKYNPTSWEPGYFVYMPKVPTPKMIYAVIRIQNPQGMMDYVKAFFKGKSK